MMDKIKNILWIIPVLFVWTWVVAAPARAQPRLKAGQEVEIYYKGETLRCPKVVGFEDGEFICVNPSSIFTNTFHQPLDKADGYRILKPAPRPEFKLPHTGNCGPGWSDRYNHSCWSRYNDETIADELRYLRKEIKKHHE